MTLDARAWIDQWPVTRPFGDLSMPLYGAHTGIDLGMPEGTAIPALRDGVVDLDDDDASYDPLRWQTWSGIVVRYRLADGMSILCAHLSSNLVSAGEVVHAGDSIGFCGATGAATGPHLHLEVRDPNGQFIDPLVYFAPGGDMTADEVKALIAEYAQRLETNELLPIKTSLTVLADEVAALTAHIHDAGVKTSPPKQP